MDRPVVVGAVAYDPRVVPIWEGMRDYFREVGPAIDYVLVSNYDRLVQLLLERQIDIAWNTNLAWVKVHRRTNGTCRALAMRDVDAQFTTILVARTDRQVESLADLRGKRLALELGRFRPGRHFAHPFPSASRRRAGTRLRPLALRPRRRQARRHGGQRVGSPAGAARQPGGCRAQLGDATWIRQVAEGRVDPSEIRPIWTSEGYCHCNFTVLADFPEDLGQRWTESLLAMSYDNPRWRGLMDLEGLKRWIVADEATREGYRVLFEAVERQGLARNWQS